MQFLGFPLDSPQAAVNRAVSDLAAIARMARAAPGQLERILELGEEMAEIGRGVLAIAERLDQRADAALVLGERLDARAAELLKLGRKMEKLGKRVDKRGAEIVDRSDELVASAATVAETGSELIAMLPTLERAIQMASPLEGAIDRVGRLVDRLPGGTARRTVVQIDADAAAQTDADTAAQIEADATEIIADADDHAGTRPGAGTRPEAEREPTGSPEGLDQAAG